MESVDVVRYGLIKAVSTEVLGMIAENMARAQNGESLAYCEADFQAKAEELRNISYAHEHQL